MELRQMLATIQSDSDKGDYRRHHQMIDDIESIASNLMVERGVDRRFLRMKLPTSLLGIQVEGDGAGVRLPIPAALYTQYFLSRRYRALIRDVMAELAAPAQFGQLKTRLNSWAWLPDAGDVGRSAFYAKKYSFPSKFHRPLNHAEED